MTRPITFTLLLLASLSNPVPLRAEEPLQSERAGNGGRVPSPDHVPVGPLERDLGLSRSPIVSDASAPTPSGAVGSVLLGGWATWYEDPRKTGFYAAAGPLLREALGDWRGRYVTVEAGGIEVVVHLTDWCACGERGGIPTLLDLSREAFAALGDPAMGVIRVSIEIDGSPRPDPRDDAMRDEVRDLPATDTVP